MEKRAVLICLSFLLATQANAQQFIRRSMITEKQQESRETSVSSLEVVHKNLAKKMSEQLAKSQYNLNEQQLADLMTAMVTNEGARKMTSGILNDVSSSPATKAINKLRLEIMSMIGGMDPYNQELVDSASRNADKQAALDIANLVVFLGTRSASPKALEAMRLFLTEVQTALQANTDLAQVLRVAQDTIAIEKGIEVQVEHIAELSRHNNLSELFKAEDDIVAVVVKGPAKDSVGLNVRMSRKQAEIIQTEVHERAEQIIELALHPESVSEKLSGESLKSLNSAVAETNVFLDNNQILNRQHEVSTKGQEEAAEVRTTVDDLLNNLEALGAVIGAKGFQAKAAKLLRNVPIVGSKLVGSNVSYIKTLKEKIQVIDKTLVDGAKKLDANNGTLMEIKAKALNRMNELQIEMARTTLLADTIADYAHQLEARGDTRTVTILRSEIIPRVERELNAAMVLYGVLTGAMDGITQVIKTNQEIINSAHYLRTVAAPAIAVTQTVKVAAQEAEAALRQQKQVARFVESQLKTLADSVIAVNKMTAEMASQSVVDPVVLAEVFQKLTQERADMQKRMADAGEKLRASNAKLKEVLNKSSASTESSSVGIGVNNLLNQGYGTKK